MKSLIVIGGPLAKEYNLNHRKKHILGDYFDEAYRQAGFSKRDIVIEVDANNILQQIPSSLYDTIAVASHSGIGSNLTIPGLFSRHSTIDFLSDIAIYLRAEGSLILHSCEGEPIARALSLEVPEGYISGAKYPICLDQSQYHIASTPNIIRNKGGVFSFNEAAFSIETSDGLPILQTNLLSNQGNDGKISFENAFGIYKDGSKYII